MGQVWGLVGGRLNVPANMICQWGTLRYLKWFGPCRGTRHIFVPFFSSVGFNSSIEYVYVACVSFLSVGHVWKTKMNDFFFFFKNPPSSTFQDFLGQAYCTLGEVVGSLGSRSEKPLGWVGLPIAESVSIFRWLSDQCWLMIIAEKNK